MKFTMYMEPVPKGRPKFTVRSGFAIAYTPKKTRLAQADMRTQALPFKPDKPLDGPLFLKATFFRRIPKSFSNKRHLMAENQILKPITKPDTSNYLRALEDSLKSLFYHDDSQITDHIISKRYSDTPRIEVEIEKT